MCSKKRNPAFQRPYRTDIFTESRFSHPHYICIYNRKHQYKYQKHQVFHVSKSLPQFFLRKWHLIEQFLNQAKRAYESTNSSSEYHTERQHKSHYIKAEPKLYRSAHRLHRTDRTGQTRSRAGITVHSRITELLPLSFVYPAVDKITKISVGITKRCNLNYFSSYFLTYFHPFTSN